MPARWLTENEQNRLTRFPETVSETDLVTFFTLTKNDFRLLTKLHNNTNRLGFALQTGTLRWLGFVPENLAEAPTEIVEFLARQISASPELIRKYGTRPQTRTDHLAEIEDYLGFHKMNPAEESEIEEWLSARAAEHDRPLLLLQILGERLQARKIIRPGLTVLERLVAKARHKAREATWQTVAHLVTDETKIFWMICSK